MARPRAPEVPAAATDSRETQLLAIACRLFAHKGFDATSLRDIAEAAHITKAALYYYFPNKDTLYERIVIESLQALVDTARAAVDRAPTPTEKLRAFMRASARRLEEHRDAWLAGSNAFWQASNTGQRGQALRLRDEYEQMLRSCIAAGVAAGELRPVDPAMAGRLLLSCLSQLPRWHRLGGPLSSFDVIDQYLDIALLGMMHRYPPRGD
jgi:AcrR family transcriptional regulator